MRFNYKLLILLIIVWAVTFLFFATRINIKGYGEHAPTFFAEEGYNFEYKHGFPTPWLSKYYVIPVDEVANYKSSRSTASTPSNNYMVYEDISYPVLATQGLLTLITPLVLLAAIKSMSLAQHYRNKK